MKTPSFLAAALTGGLLASPLSAQVLSRARTPSVAGSIVPASTVGTDVGDIVGFQLTRSEDRVVYSASEANGTVELFSIKSDGGPALRLAGPYPAGRFGVLSFQVTSDDRHVVFKADAGPAFGFELYSVPVNGGPVVEIARPAAHPALGSNDEYLAQDDRVLFLSGSGNARALLSASLDGSSFTSLGASGSGWQVTSDGQRVVFSSSLLGGQLRGAPVDGSAPAVLLGATSVSSWFAFTPGDRMVSWSWTGSERILTAQSIFGNSGLVLLAQGEQGLPSLAVSADGQYAVYRTSESDPLLRRYYAAPLDASTEPALLTTGLPEGEGLFLELDTGGGHALFSTQDGNGRSKLYAARLDGSSGPIELGRAGDDLVVTVPASPFALRWGPYVFVDHDDEHVIFFVQDELGQVSILRRRIDGTDAPAVLTTLDSDAAIDFPTVFWPWIHSEPRQDRISERLLFLQDGRLFSVPTDGVTPAVELNAPLAEGATGLVEFLVGRRTGRVYCVGDQRSPGVMEMFRVPIDGSQLPTQLVDL